LIGSGGISGSARAAETNVWKLVPLERGQRIEQALGHNLPSNFPVIDRFENGIATSIKSIDLDAASYLNDGILNRVLTGYVDKTAAFSGRTWAERAIESDDILGRGLDLVIPHSGNVNQQIIINQLIEYGAERSVIVNPIIYP
jgi:filamentous hemagglutinin